jgi:hypothetical protein
VDFVGIDPDAPVCHRDDGRVALLSDPDVDDAAVRALLDGVPDLVREHLSEPVGVPVSDEPIRRGDQDSMLAGRLAQTLGNLTDERGKIGSLRMHREAATPGLSRGDEILDEAIHHSAERSMALAARARIVGEAIFRCSNWAYPMMPLIGLRKS